MNKKNVTAFGVFLLATISFSFAMDTMTNDTMMMKDHMMTGGMMSGDSMMMKHDDTMMMKKDDHMMMNDKMTMKDMKKLSVAALANKMGYNWNKNKAMLAKKAGITNYSGTTKQNIKIQNYLLTMSKQYK